MFTVDETGKVLENFELDPYLGKIETTSKDVYYQVVGEIEPITINIYWNADGTERGRDQKWVLKDPENSHWQMYDIDGVALDYPIEVDTDELDILSMNFDKIYFNIYHPYTPEEAEEYRKEREKLEKEQAEREAHQEAISALPDRVDSVEGNLDAVILYLADVVGGAV